MPAPSELEFYSALGVPLREPIKLSLPLSYQIWQVLARADIAAGSTVNEYKTCLQLPGSHLVIHLAATDLLFIKPCLMYLESMKLSGFRNQSGLKAHQSNLDTTRGLSIFLILAPQRAAVRGEDSCCHDGPRNCS